MVRAGDASLDMGRAYHHSRRLQPPSRRWARLLLHADGGRGRLLVRGAQPRQRVERELSELAIAGGAQRIVPQIELLAVELQRGGDVGVIERLARQRGELPAGVALLG